ncbi:MAG: DUF2147 domain-containing protein [Flavobacteriia bacterium]|nr:DUF2147 domain-containing protein [Flavobacteriia bacterium]
MKLLITLVFTINYLLPPVGSCIGKWTTFDDETGKKKSTVELYKVDGKLHGKIIYLYPKEGREDDPLCTKCSGEKKNKHIVGMQIASGMIWNGSEWEDGSILDPENGKTYTVSMWLDKENSNKLNVRGYIGIFYRTQKWVRAD